MAATTAIDPLELMRESIMAGVPLVVNGSGVYTFGQHSFPETTKTKFRRTAKSGGYYTLRDIAFFAAHALQQGGGGAGAGAGAGSTEQDYRRKCTASGAVPVTLQDKQDLKMYLSGQIAMCDQLLDESNAAAGGLGLRVGVGAGGIGALSAAVTGGMGGGAAGTAAASAGGTMSAASVLYLDDRTLAEQQLQKAQRRRQRRQEEEEGKAEIIAANAELRRKLNNNNSNNHNNDGGDTDANAAEPSEAEMASYLETNRACLQSCHTLNSLPLGQMLRTPPTTPGVTTSQQQQPQPSLVDRRAQALCSYPESDFSNVLSLFHDTVLKQLKGSGATPKSSAAGGAGGFETPGSGTGTGTAASGAGGAPVRRPRVPMPIVVVPSALTSMITLANAQSLLADSVYIDANTARLQHQSSAEGSSQGVTASASPKPLSDFVIMTTKLGTAHPIPVRFVDKPTKLTEAEWRHQVVAVFATGQRWQFKDFCPHLPGLFPHAPVDLFQQVLGVHLMYDEKTIDPVVSSWNCAVLKISRNRRHQDAVAANMFWSLLTEHIKLKRPWLLEPPATTATGAASAVSSSHKKH